MAFKKYLQIKSSIYFEAINLFSSIKNLKNEK